MSNYSIFTHDYILYPFYTTSQYSNCVINYPVLSPNTSTLFRDKTQYYSFYTTLISCIKFNNINEFKDLLTNAIDNNFNINFNPSNEIQNSSLLMFACKLNKLPFVKILLQYGANINATDHLLYNSLHYTIISGCYELSTYLILEGINIDQKNIHNETPIDMLLCFRNFNVNINK